MKNKNMKIGDIIDFEFKNNQYKCQYLETQKTIFNEEIVKVKLLKGDADSLGLGKNKLILLKDGEFLKPYQENKEEVTDKKKKNKDLTKTKNLSLF